jgi:cell division protein FtsW (lipid II flippase)
MNDFGTALIFFCAFLVIAYMRSGSVGTVGLAITALGYAGVLALDIAPTPCGGSPPGGMCGKIPWVWATSRPGR